MEDLLITEDDFVSMGNASFEGAFRSDRNEVIMRNRAYFYYLFLSFPKRY